jgi:hypothetical protein
VFERDVAKEVESFHSALVSLDIASSKAITCHVYNVGYVFHSTKGLQDFGFRLLAVSLFLLLLLLLLLLFGQCGV